MTRILKSNLLPLLLVMLAFACAFSGCGAKDAITTADKSTLALTGAIQTVDALVQAKLLDKPTAQKLLPWFRLAVVTQVKANEALLAGDSAADALAIVAHDAAVAYADQVANARAGRAVQQFSGPVPELPATRP